MKPPLLARPEVILTHESDLDGFVSGFLLQRLARQIFGVDVEVQAYHYQGWKQRVLRESAAWGVRDLCATHPGLGDEYLHLLLPRCLAACRDDHPPVATAADGALDALLAEIKASNARSA